MNAVFPLVQQWPALGRFLLLAWIIAACAAAAAQDIPQQDVSTVQSRFQRTAQYLQGAAPESRSEFAAIALRNLAIAYSAEAKLARQQARAAGSSASLRGWSYAVDQYARQMPLLLQDVDLGFPVSFILGGETSLAISIADRVVILSHPRLNQQSAFEQQILRDFCASHRCDLFIGDESESEPISMATRRVKPDWMFTRQGWACSHEGIKVWFKSEENLRNSRLICEQFLQEVVTLAEEMSWQYRHAVTIDWNELEIRPTPHRPEHMVRLNATGDSILVTVPLLYASPELFEHIIPWVRHRLSGQGEADIELDAASYGWQKP